MIVVLEGSLMYLDPREVSALLRSKQFFNGLWRSAAFELPKGRLEQSHHLARGTVQSLIMGIGVIGHADGLHAGDSHFDLTALVVPALLGGTVLVVEVHFSPRDPIREAAESFFDHGLDVVGPIGRAFGLTAGVDLNLHHE